MSQLKNLQPERVFYYFHKITKIPHGSGDTDKIASFCVNFAKEHNLRYYRDDANNVVIYKNGTKHLKDAEPVILQGHLDMVCQKTEDNTIDFSKDALDIFVDGDFIKAKNTTLGADNGIAVACVLAILESDTYAHPPIEAVFTTDEETGMIGATKLDTSVLSGKKMINIDSEEEDTMTVSCAGGSDFKVFFNFERETVTGTEIELTLKGLLGGHSGIEIDKGRVNSNILAGRVLNHLKSTGFDLLSVDGGNKTNAITNLTKIRLCANNKDEFIKEATEYLEVIKNELSVREPDFTYQIKPLENGTFSAISNESAYAVIYALACVPNGVIDMSAEIQGLVETSLNLGILETDERNIKMHISLRSNKETTMNALEEKLSAFFECLPCEFSVSDKYPSWEFNNNSTLQKLYKEVYENETGKALKVEAIHAGLECGVFASKIKDFDCISIGPDMFDVHTVKERLSVSSTERIFKILLKVLENCK
ncbi:MAG: aminoacyl-histidine dipeptidase [Ruminococcaceae bacterium]|nr:aminoacyl-histidine dipeptidase [Oscillospiraceae bacterium]